MLCSHLEFRYCKFEVVVFFYVKGVIVSVNYSDAHHNTIALILEEKVSVFYCSYYLQFTIASHRMQIVTLKAYSIKLGVEN